MSDLPQSVQERLDRLSRRFLERLPHQIREIQAFMDQAETTGRESLREARLHVHRISGSAATFGFVELGSAARALEDFIEKDLAEENRSVSLTTRQAFREFTDIVDALMPTQSPEEISTDTTNDTTNDTAETSASMTVTRAPTISVRYDRAVVLVGDIPGLPEDFGDQVAVFRFAVSFAGSLEVVPEFCEAKLIKHEKNPEPYEYVILISTVHHLAGTTDRLKILQDLRARFEEKIVLILVGDEDDFDTRLRSVRYGANAFLSVPIDITRFVDQIDNLTSATTPEPYHILIVDDDQDQLSDTARILQNAGMVTSVVTEPQNVFKVMVEYRPELILLDMYMPKCTGPELATIIRQNENFVGVPILFLSVETDAAKQMDAIKSGGEGFLQKPIIPEHLVTAVAVRAHRTRAMRYYMERDSLTGLLNHTNLKQQLAQELQRAKRVGLPLVFAMIDLDKFKLVNDRYGHLTGDRVIKNLARVLQERLRRSDTIGRYGGEEFGVILFNTSASWAETILDEIRESFARVKQTDGTTEFTVTLSCGLAEYPRFDSATALNEAADAALYKAKEAGRNRVLTANGIDQDGADEAGGADS